MGEIDLDDMGHVDEAIRWAVTEGIVWKRRALWAERHLAEALRVGLEECERLRTPRCGRGCGNPLYYAPCSWCYGR